MIGASAGGLGDALVHLLQERHGGDAAQVLLTFLCALSGLTNYPVHARTVGSGIGHDAIASTVEELIGTDACQYLTTLTEAGIMSLEASGQKGVSTILYSGDLSEPRLVRAFGRMVAGQKLRSLDGSPTGHDRYRKVDRRLSCIFFRADDLAEPDILSRLLTIKIVRNPEATKRALMQALAQFKDGQAFSAYPELLKGLKSRIRQSPLQAQVTFADDMTAKVRAQDIADVYRIQQVLSLAAVWRILNTESASPNTRITGQTKDVEIVLALLHQIGVEDERIRIAPRHAATLRVLQAKQTAFKTPDNPDGLFTFYNVRSCLPEPKPSIDTIRNNFIALEQAGYLEKEGTIAGRNAWTLTPAGREYHPTSLTEHLQELLQVPTIPTAPKQDEPPHTDRSSTKVATVSTNGRSSEGFQQGVPSHG
jgi:hypothetical protein